jgi:hypothetical protein
MSPFTGEIFNLYCAILFITNINKISVSSAAYSAVKLLQCFLEDLSEVM